MSSFVIHLLVPIMVALSTRIFRVRDVWIWSWAAVVSDLDYVGWMLHVEFDLPNVHRALLHNAWILLGLLGLMAWGWRRWRQAEVGNFLDFARGRPGYVLVPFFYFSHIFLDTFQGGNTLLWPLTLATVYWNFRLAFDTTGPVPMPDLRSDVGAQQGVPDVTPYYVWLTGEEFAIVLLYLLSLAVVVAHHRLRPTRDPATPRGGRVRRIRARRVPHGGRPVTRRDDDAT